MSSVSAATSMFVAQQAQARQQTMATVALKQGAQQEQAIADMLLASAQTAQSAPPPGQGRAVDIRA